MKKLAAVFLSLSVLFSCFPMAFAAETAGDYGRSYPETENTKVFSHTISDRNGIESAVFYATVTGVYSQADNYATLTSITGSFTGDYASRSTYSQNI